MADSKLSELTAATSAAAGDSLYLVQSSTSKQITTANLFASVATPVSFGDTVSIGDHETVTAAGELAATKNVHVITNPGTGGTLTLPTGATGQIKIIIMSSNTSTVTMTLDDSDLGHDTVTFDNAGDTATLIYAASKWWVIGGSAAVVN